MLIRKREHSPTKIVPITANVVMPNKPRVRVEYDPAEDTNSDTGSGNEGGFI
jgi:hypothetical protein